MSASEFVQAARTPYKRILGYLKPYKGRFITGVVFGVIGGLFNGILILAIKTVFTIVLPPDPSKAQLPDKIHLFDKIPGLHHVTFNRPNLAPENEWIFVAAVCLLIPVLILIRGLFEYLQAYCMMWVGNRVLYQVRDEAFSSLMGQSLRFYNKAKQGELMQTVFNQTRIVASLGTDIVSSMVKHPVSILVILGTLLTIDPIYTIGALVVFPLCILPVMHISRKVRKAGSREEEEAGAIMVTMQESFAGIRVVKAYAREEYERERFNAGSRKMMEFIMRWGKAMEIVGPLVETVASLGMAFGLVYAWWTQKTANDFLVLNMALMSMYPHAKQLSRIQVMLQKTLLATSKVLEVIDAEPEIKDAPDAMEMEDVRGEIELREVSFAYAKGIPALQNVSLTIEAGKSYALVGQSGAGKSTIMSLLMRFYDPDSGAILIDGRDIREYTQRSLRDNIGLVSQETFLFHDTIYNNIRYGRLDATKSEVEAAAKLAHAHEFIIEQAEGYNTELGDKGCTLSGGQQQRISIARAILRNAPVLLLDEAYSALDSESERMIHEAMEMLAKGKTVIAIAHRLSTILNADRIVVMKDSRILDVGPHAELLERCEEYRRLYELQFHGHDLPALSAADRAG
ncbi:MAG: ABC transporter ATP-binding protein [Verrucomicrobiae bacterium]|nr:ABC transporter ATP-binding protein [Verrucomicrobiae bacterium]